MDPECVVLLFLLHHMSYVYSVFYTILFTAKFNWTQIVTIYVYFLLNNLASVRKAHKHTERHRRTQKMYSSNNNNSNNKGTNSFIFALACYFVDFILYPVLP